MRSWGLGPHNRISALWEESKKRAFLSLPRWTQRQKVAACKPGRKPSPGNLIRWHLNLRFPSLRDCKKYVNSCCLNHPGYGSPSWLIHTPSPMKAESLPSLSFFGCTPSAQGYQIVPLHIIVTRVSELIILYVKLPLFNLLCGFHLLIGPKLIFQYFLF